MTISSTPCDTQTVSAYYYSWTARYVGRQEEVGEMRIAERSDTRHKRALSQRRQMGPRARCFCGSRRQPTINHLAGAPKKEMIITMKPSRRYRRHCYWLRVVVGIYRLAVPSANDPWLWLRSSIIATTTTRGASLLFGMGPRRAHSLSIEGRSQ